MNQIKTNKVNIGHSLDIVRLKKSKSFGISPKLLIPLFLYKDISIELAKKTKSQNSITSIFIPISYSLTSKNKMIQHQKELLIFNNICSSKEPNPHLNLTKLTLFNFRNLNSFHILYIQFLNNLLMNGINL